MQVLFIALTVIAAGMIIALVVGVALKLIGLLLVALLIVGAVAWTMHKIRGPSSRGVSALGTDRANRRPR